jgi:1-phosphofructokinase
MGWAAGAEMIATVTLNPAVDKTVVVPDFAAGKMNRARVERIDPGSKGTNVAKTPRQVGCPVVAFGFIAGLNGQFLRRSLDEPGIPHDLIDVPGETRVNLKIEDPVRRRETESNEPGFPVTRERLEEMEQRVKEYAARADAAVFSGSLPPGAGSGTCARLIDLASRRGARTVLDTTGAALAERIGAQLDLVKLNRAEAGELPGDASGPAGAPGSVRAMGRAQVANSPGVEGAGAATAASCGGSVESRAAVEALLSQVRIEQPGEVSAT